MTSWYSNLLTTTTSRISNLRSTLLAGEADGDTEDDTHVCRVLRAYYTEKGRPFPNWLPPDPKAPPPVAPVYSQQQQVGSRYGGMTQQQGGGGGLSSLWDNNPVSRPQDTQSLRQGRGAPPPMRGVRGDGGSGQPNPFSRGQEGGRDNIQARPLPSQRAGSYQSGGALGRDATATPPASSLGAPNVQDRLKQRLWGGSRTASPGGTSPFQPPAQQGGAARGGADYEDRFAPGGMYDAGSGGRNEKPFMASNSPWANNEQEYSSGGGGSASTGRAAGRRMGGLPSGPRMR